MLNAPKIKKNENIEYKNSEENGVQNILFFLCKVGFSR